MSLEFVHVAGTSIIAISFVILVMDIVGLILQLAFFIVVIVRLNACYFFDEKTTGMKGIHDGLCH